MRIPALALAAALLAGSGLALAPKAGQAAPALVTSGLNLRAGPGPEYPVVAVLQPGVTVDVIGCLDGYGWCDVTIGDSRGWVSGQFLQGYVEQRPMPFVSAAPLLGLPLIGFSIGSYWDDHYRGRPWYRDRDRWLASRPPPPGYYGPPPRYRPPPPHAGPRPGWDRPDWHRPGGDRPHWDRPPGDRPDPRPDHGPRPDPRPDFGHRPDGPRPGPRPDFHGGGPRPEPGRGPQGHDRGPDRGGPPDRQAEFRGPPPGGDRGGRPQGGERGPGRGGPDREQRGGGDRGPGPR